MMTPAPIVSAAQARDYFLKYQKHDYYQGEERQCPGQWHGEGARLLGLRGDVVEAVRQHHSDTLTEHNEDDTHTLARILGAAGLIAKLLCENPNKEVVAQTCATAGEIVGLNALAFQNALQDLDSSISEFAKLLDVDIIESKVFLRVCEIVTETLEDQASAV